MTENLGKVGNISYSPNNLIKNFLIFNLVGFIFMGVVVFIFSIGFFSTFWHNFFQFSFLNFDKNNFTFFLQYEFFLLSFLLANELNKLPIDDNNLIVNEAKSIARKLAITTSTIYFLNFICTILIIFSYIQTDNVDNASAWFNLFHALKVTYTWFICIFAQAIFGLFYFLPFILVFLFSNKELKRPTQSGSTAIN